jgi:hypothetical protein
MGPFKSVEIENLLAQVQSSSDIVRACAEGMMDNIIVGTHQTVHDNFKTTNDIRDIMQHTGGEVGELRGKIEEILQHQIDFQQVLDSISGKNNLLNFLMEYLSRLRRNILQR